MSDSLSIFLSNPGYHQDTGIVDNNPVNFAPAMTGEKAMDKSSRATNIIVFLEKQAPEESFVPVSISKIKEGLEAQRKIERDKAEAEAARADQDDGFGDFGGFGGGDDFGGDFGGGEDDLGGGDFLG